MVVLYKCSDIATGMGGEGGNYVIPDAPKWVLAFINKVSP